MRKNSMTRSRWLSRARQTRPPVQSKLVASRNSLLKWYQKITSICQPQRRNRSTKPWPRRWHQSLLSRISRVSYSRITMPGWPIMKAILQPNLPQKVKPLQHPHIHRLPLHLLTLPICRLLLRLIWHRIRHQSIAASVTSTLLRRLSLTGMSPVFQHI